MQLLPVRLIPMLTHIVVTDSSVFVKNEKYCEKPCTLYSKRSCSVKAVQTHHVPSYDVIMFRLYIKRNLVAFDYLSIAFRLFYHLWTVNKTANIITGLVDGDEASLT